VTTALLGQQADRADSSARSAHDGRGREICRRSTSTS
jgi:hypothetical protein